MKNQVLHTAWCYISDGAAGEIWYWSLLGVKGLRQRTLKMMPCRAECPYRKYMEPERPQIDPGGNLIRSRRILYCILEAQETTNNRYTTSHKVQWLSNEADPPIHDTTAKSNAHVRLKFHAKIARPPAHCKPLLFEKNWLLARVIAKVKTGTKVELEKLSNCRQRHLLLVVFCTFMLAPKAKIMNESHLITLLTCRTLPWWLWWLSQQNRAFTCCLSEGTCQKNVLKLPKDRLRTLQCEFVHEWNFNGTVLSGMAT